MIEKLHRKATAPELLPLMEGVKSIEIRQCGLVRHAGSRKERYVQRRCWSFHFYHYHGSLQIGERRFDFGPNHISLIPPACVGEWSFPGVATHSYVHFRVGGNVGPSEPVCLDASSDEARLRTDMEFIGANQLTCPRACEIRLWDLLWRLALGGEGRPAGGEPHPVLQIAVSIIRNELDQGLRVADLAQRCNVSEGHLNRLFRRNFNESTQAYLQRQRLQAAERLLRESRQPILSVARQIGFDDLQAFNKFIRQRTGVAPSVLRKLSL